MRSRHGSAGARHNRIRTGDEAEPRQGTRSTRTLPLCPSHRRYMRRMAWHGSQGRIHLRLWQRQGLPPCPRTQPPRKDFSYISSMVAAPTADRPAVALKKVGSQFFWLRILHLGHVAEYPRPNVLVHEIRRPNRAAQRPKAEDPRRSHGVAGEKRKPVPFSTLPAAVKAGSRQAHPSTVRATRPPTMRCCRHRWTHSWPAAIACSRC
jgi:hypothetical protein